LSLHEQHARERIEDLGVLAFGGSVGASGDFFGKIEIALDSRAGWQWSMPMRSAS
jgi:hypothetical protein